jgi:Domain of unknown function (DUF1835)
MAGLIITNGDSAADLLRAAGRTETILPWRDVLHEGPIASGDLNACTRLRVSYLAKRFVLPEAEIAAEFTARDTLMRRHSDFASVELWFEHDLYDQLQLLQVLAFFAAEGRSQGLALVQANDFLGSQTASTILRFARQQRPVTEVDLDLARTVWTELAAATPQPVVDRVARGGRPSLPFLVPALHRFLEELPSQTNGLNRTEQTIVDGIGSGVATAKALFSRAIANEEAAFMGDLSFLRLIEDLAFAEVPLVTGLRPEAGSADFYAAKLSLTAAGENVRAGLADHVQLSALDRWWAGTRLVGRSVWRYDRAAERLVVPIEVSA